MTKIGIVAHESRIINAYNLFKTVRADYIRIDNGALGCERNHRDVWACTATMAADDEWVIVLEDDAVVPSTTNFRKQAKRALASADVNVASFYLGRKRPISWQPHIERAVAQANSKHACWITSNTTLHAVALAIRGPALVASMLENTAAMTRPIDERITMWCKQFGHATAYSYPSLVDHADETPCITTRFDGAVREKGRVAWCVGVRPQWTSRSVTLKP